MDAVVAEVPCPHRNCCLVHDSIVVLGLSLGFSRILDSRRIQVTPFARALLVSPRVCLTIVEVEKAVVGRRLRE